MQSHPTTTYGLKSGGFCVLVMVVVNRKFAILALMATVPRALRNN